jgi:hypothetical protein
LTGARRPWWQDPYGVLLRTAVVVGWLPGFSLGLVLLLELALLQRLGAGWWPHAQTHAHAQIYGFAGLFFFGVATQILPRFLGHPLTGRGTISAGGLLLGASLIARLSVQPFASGTLRDAALLAAAWIGMLGGALIVVVFARAVVASARPRERWQLLLGLGLLSWALGMLAVFWSTVALAQGQMLIPQPIQELALHLGLWGFIVPVTLAVSLRAFPNLLLLRPGPVLAQRGAIAVYIVGFASVALTWFAQAAFIITVDIAAGPRAAGWLAMALGGGLLVWSLRVYEPPSRASQAPHITEPTRLWFRLAAGYLLLALIGSVYFSIREAVFSAPASALEMSATRHALAMGYLMPLIVGMAGRILPEHSGDMTRRSRELAAMVWLWLVGAGLRVAGELWSGYAGPGAVLMSVGATLAFFGFAWFSIRLWASIGRRRPETLGL